MTVVSEQLDGWYDPALGDREPVGAIAGTGHW
jgi:hypothetical protein